jgi:hypothetical protein
MRKVALTAALVCCLACSGGHNEGSLREALSRASGVVQLPAGVIEISSELTMPAGAHDLEIQGSPSGTVIRTADNFRGRAVFHVKSGSNIRFANFTVDGNRAALETPLGLPPSDETFSEFYPNNGLLAEGIEQLTISGVRFRNITGFPILVSHSTGVLIERVQIENSGSKNAKGRNNTTGGILLEEGTAGFQIQECTLSNVRGNGVWTHSLYTSPRNQDGLITNNHFDTIGRDAIQIGHATNVRVENNAGSRIGYPAEEVDVEGGGTPVAIDTAGNVDQSAYAHNRFEEINGKCIDLDGFHHGEVRANTCVNRGAAEDYPYGHYAIVFNNTNPDMESENISVSENEIDGTKFGGIFIIGSGHKVVRNRLRNLNKAHCNENAAKFGCSHFPGEPDLLQTGVYLGRRAERPAIARNNVVADNVISGYKMSTRCIAAAPGVSLAANRIQRNRCSDTEE